MQSRLAPFLLFVFALAVGCFAQTANRPAPPTRLAEIAGHPVFAVLKDGTLAGFTLTNENGRQIVQMQTSPDRSRTWTPPQSVLTLPSDVGGWGGPEVLVDRNGEVHLIFLNDAKTGIIKTGEAERPTRMNERRLDIWHAKSTNGRTQWQQPKKIWEGYTGALNSIIQMNSGRIVLPFSYRTKRTWRDRGEGVETFTFMGEYDAIVLYSDDDGDTWTLSPDPLKVVTPDIRGAYGAVEPVVIELKDGRVWMLIRTQVGRFYESFSPDGAHWSPAQPTAIINSDSPAGLTRLPDGRIVLLWNECLRYPYAYGGRQVLHGAISDDEGKTWRGHREVMRDLHRNEPPPPGGDFGTAYPFPITMPDGKVLFASGQGGGRRASYVLDPAWLLETTQSTNFANGIDDWSTYGTKGVELVDANGAKALRIAHVDAKWPAAAVWNFPQGRIGSVTVQFSTEPGFRSMNIGLTDHYSTPFDDQDQFYNLFNLPVTADKLGTAKLEPNRTHTLKLAWNTDEGRCTVTLDGRPAGVLKLTRQTTGVDYIRFRSTAQEVETGGVKILSVSADVTPSWPKSSAAISPGAPPAFDSSLAGHAYLLDHGPLMAWYTGYRKEEGGPFGWKLCVGAANLVLED